MKFLGLVVALAAVCPSTAFHFGQMMQKQQSMQLQAASSEGDSRRDFLTKTGAAALSITSSSGLGWGVLAPPANAVGGVGKVSERLKAYGLPPLGPVPNGLTPLLEIWGKGKNRFPLLVLMSHPVTWVVTLPSNDVNGEDGTIQAGEYSKGDTATLFVYSEGGHVDNIASAGKPLYEKVLQKAISQKSANIYQNFKVTKIEPQSGAEYNGQEYVICDFKYELLTGAGFEVDRRGVAAITSQGPAVEVLWAASTRERYKKTEPVLRDIVSSFRCYADGLNFSSELVQYDEERV